MEIEAGAEQIHAHGAALDVPARTAFAPWTRPKDFAIFRNACLPKGKIGNGFFGVFVGADAFANAHLFEIQIDELTVLAAAAAVFIDAEVNGTVVGAIGDAARDEFFDE